MTDNLQAVRELVKRWVIESNWRSGGVRATYKRCADELESALAQDRAQPPAACDMGALCIGCAPRNADGSCPGEHVAAKTGGHDNV